MANKTEIEVYFPQKILEVIFEPCRYLVLFGGRGGAKSWSVAKALLIMAAETPMRILCAREWMSSIADSVHKLLCDQILELNLEHFYTIGKTTITGRNGSEFRFSGLKTNISGIKSYEAIDVVWLEEAANISKHSYEVLIPTIRKPNSKIIITFNPELESDATWQMFVKHKRPNSIVVKVNYYDNPFFPDVLKEEMEFLKRIDHPAYEHIYLGEPKTFLEGAIYSSEIKAALDSNRITNVPYEASSAVHVFFDLGWRDNTSMIFAQIINRQYRIIDFYENSGEKIQHYIQIIQSKGYILGTMYLPHDSSRDSMTSERSVEASVRQMGGCAVQVLPKLSIHDGIQAARTIFPQCYFDEEKCSDLITALRKYRYDDVHLNLNKPLHDESSHAADAFRYLAIGLKESKVKFDYAKFKLKSERSYVSDQGWMNR